MIALFTIPTTYIIDYITHISEYILYPEYHHIMYISRECERVRFQNRDIPTSFFGTVD